MTNKLLNTVLQSMTHPNEKIDFIGRLVEQLNKRVQKILLFGPCNNNAAKKASNIYFQDKENRFFPRISQTRDLDALPAVIANQLMPTKNFNPNDFEEYLRKSYVYGTGTCECFSIVGAYILATEFNVSLSIETAYADESHTYIRLHTHPEYIIDFWAQMTCEYNDDATWNEVLGPTMLRRKSELKVNARFNSEELIAMGTRVFTEENKLFRHTIIQAVLHKTEQFKTNNTLSDNQKTIIRAESAYWSSRS